MLTRQNQPYRKRIPYGMMNFEDVRTRDCYYVDKTPFIEDVEAANYIRNDCQFPEYMVEDNIRVDYNKLRMLIRHDKNFEHDARVIQRLVTDGFVTGSLKKGFPAESINDPDNFVSLCSTSGW